MSASIRVITGLTLLLAIVQFETECAGQVAVKAVRAQRMPAKIQTEKRDDTPADALKVSNLDGAAKKADAKTEKEQQAADQAKVEFLAGGLRALFGGPVVAPQIMVPEEQQADIDAQVDAMAQQFSMQFRPILKSELGFIRLICSDLTPEQRQRIRKSADAAVNEAAKQQARHQNRMQRGRGGAAAPAEPGKLIRDALEKALQETLDESEHARYIEEAKHRTQTRRRASVLSLVARLDGQLYLTAQQREKIVDSLTSQWQDSWESWSKMMNMYGDRYFPMVPDHCVIPFLNPEQKQVWQATQKIGYGGWWGGVELQNVDEDGWWGDEPAGKEVMREGGVLIRRIIGF